MNKTHIKSLLSKLPFEHIFEQPPKRFLNWNRIFENTIAIFCGTIVVWGIFLAIFLISVGQLPNKQQIEGANTRISALEAEVESRIGNFYNHRHNIFTGQIK